jgi:hypothetical protein
MFKAADQDFLDLFFLAEPAVAAAITAHTTADRGI